MNTIGIPPVVLYVIIVGTCCGICLVAYALAVYFEALVHDMPWTLKRTKEALLFIAMLPVYALFIFFNLAAFVCNKAAKGLKKVVARYDEYRSQPASVFVKEDAA